MKQELTFKPRARLLLQLGDQLIKNSSIALLELAKNSYDADSTFTSITMRNVADPKTGIITLEDDGEGMDIEIVKNAWMEPGSDYKSKLFLKKKRTKRFARLPIGEKGIGRFGAHKMGNRIELITRKKGSDEILIEIDWRAFQVEKYLEDVPITISTREPQVFKENRTGTRITISDLHSFWTRGMVRDTFRALTALCSPFDTPESFHILFDIDEKEWLTKLLAWDEVAEYALYKFDCTIKGNKVAKFEYEFNPLPAMKKLKGRKITQDDKEVSKILKMVDKDDAPIDISKHGIGSVRFKGLIYDRTPRILDLPPFYVPT